MTIITETVNTVAEGDSLDPNAIVKCKWCEKHMLGKEAELRLNEDTGLYDVLCEFDACFDTFEEANIQRGLIITAAINPELSEIMQYPYV